MQTNIRSFVPLDKLGEGSFASVYKVRRVCDNKIYALKKIRMNHLPQKAKQNALNEVRLLASLSSPYIVGYYEAFFDENIECLCIVMEYAEQGDLRKQINSIKSQKKMMTQIQIWKIMIHLLQGLRLLHNNDILHRDLKLENIMVSQQMYKIGDMNVSKINKFGLVETQTGTPYYASPEVWKDEPYNEKSDIWSLGCILYEMTTFRPPFGGTNMNDLHKNIMRGTYHPIPKLYSNELASIIYSCLKLSPKQRPRVSELLENWSLKMYENICIDYKIEEKNTNIQMLRTIALPKNINELNKHLPKSNYHTDKGQSIAEVKQKVVEKIKEMNEIFQEKKRETVQNQPSMTHTEPIQPILEVPEELFSKPYLEIPTQEQIAEQVIQREEISSSNNKVQVSESLPQIVSQPSHKPLHLPMKKLCSLHEIVDSVQKNPEALPSSDSIKEPESIKSLEQIESFNRLIERIKASSKSHSLKAVVEQFEIKKPRRTLGSKDNKVASEPMRKSKSKSMKRTERSMSKDTLKESNKERKLQSVDFCKNIPKSNKNYKIGCYSDRKAVLNSQNPQNKLVDKYNLQPVNNKYTKILEQAKSYLKRSSSKHRKIF